MAKTTIKLKKVQTPIEEMTLTLNVNELKFLMVVLNRIGGCPDKSPRKYADDIQDAICKELNAHRTDLNFHDFAAKVCDTNRAIHFKEC